MKNDKGQALVEFVIVAPILIIIIMAIVDISNIAYKKMRLENNLNIIVDLYQKQDFSTINSLTNKENFSFSYNTNQNITIITLTKNVKIFTPFLNIILGNNYVVETKRFIYEQ